MNVLNTKGATVSTADEKLTSTDWPVLSLHRESIARVELHHRGQ